MKRLIMVVGAALAVIGAVSSAHAQAGRTALYFGGGVTFPNGDFGTYAKTGWMAQAGIGYGISEKVWVSAEGLYGSNKHSDFIGDKTDLMGASGQIGYSIGATGAKMQPYVLGGVGIMNHKFVPVTGASDSETKGMFYGGGGLYFPMGHNGFWVEARYLKRGDTSLVPVMAGFSLQLSGGK